MNKKVKNIIALCMVIVLSAGLFVAAIYEAIAVNRKTPQLDIYIDNSPIDYTEKDNVIYAMRFRKSIEDLFALISIDSGEKVVYDFIHELLYCLSVARISPQKLGNIADLVGKYREDLQKAFSGEISLDEQTILDIYLISSKSVTGFFNNFFEQTDLTEEEFAKFLYNYTSRNSSEEYKKALLTIGESDYMILLANSFYLLNIFGDIEGKTKNVTASQLEAVLYQLGKNYIEISERVGISNLKTIFGLDWETEEDDEKSAALDIYSRDLSDKLSRIFVILGKTAVNTDRAQIELLLKDTENSNEKDKTIYKLLKMQTALEIARKGFSSSAEYFADLNATDYKDIIEEYHQTFISAYKLKMELSENEISQEYLDDLDEKFRYILNLISFFATNNYSYDDLAELSDEQLNEISENLEPMEKFHFVTDDFIFSVLYVWTIYSVRGLQTGD